MAIEVILTEVQTIFSRMGPRDLQKIDLKETGPQEIDPRETDLHEVAVDLGHKIVHLKGIGLNEIALSLTKPNPSGVIGIKPDLMKVAAEAIGVTIESFSIFPILLWPVNLMKTVLQPFLLLHHSTLRYCAM